MEEDHHITVHAAHVVPLAAIVPKDKPEPAAIPESTPEPFITPDPELYKFDQVCGRLISSVLEAILVKHEGMSWSLFPQTMADVDAQNSAPLLLFEDMEDNSIKHVSHPAP